MAISAEQLNIILTAKDREFAKAMDANARRIERFAAKSNKEMSGAAKSFDLLNGAVGRLGLTLSAGAVVTGMARSLKSAVDTAAQIDTLARVAGVGTTEFQKFAIAAQTVGIGQEKLSDILKDVNDKFGDYMATGAGPLADFFDNIAPKVGLTRDAFVGLSSDQALGKYVKALQDAGVNQQEMTFYLEALASDATALNPLLADNAAMLTAIGDSAASTGQILDESMIANAKSMQTRWTEVLNVMSANWNNFWLTVAMGIDELFKISAESQLGAIQGEIDTAISDLQSAQDQLNDLDSADANIMYGKVQADALRARAEAEVASASDMLQALHQEAAILQDQIQKNENRLPPVVTGKGDTGSGTGGTAGAADTAEKAREAFDRLVSTFSDAAKASNDFAESQRVVDDALAAGVITEQEAAAAMSILVDRMKIATGEMIDLSSVARVLEGEMSNAFMSILDGTESTKDAFKSMAKSVISELYRVLVVQRMVGSIGSTSSAGSGILGAIGNIFPSLKGNAAGGAVQAGQPSVVGEHGRELFVPSSAGRVLSVPQAKAAVSGGGNGVTVNQSISFGAGVSRAEIQAMLPKIVESTKAAVFDAQRRSVNGMGY